MWHIHINSVFPRPCHRNQKLFGCVSTVCLVVVLVPLKYTTNYKGGVSVDECVCVVSGLDNKCTLYPLSLDEDPASKKRAIATHTSYLSCCKFVNSDHQVSIPWTGVGDLLHPTPSLEAYKFVRLPMKCSHCTLKNSESHLSAIGILIIHCCYWTIGHVYLLMKNCLFWLLKKLTELSVICTTSSQRVQHEY